MTTPTQNIDPIASTLHALDLMTQARVPCDNDSLSKALQARILLQAVASGQLLLTVPPPAPAAPAPEVAPEASKGDDQAPA